MYFKTIFIFLCFSFLQANNVDKYHENLCKLLVNTSNSIDNYFVDDNSSERSKTHAEFSTSFATETHLSLEKDIRFRLRLNLPKIEKNLRLVFEDDTSDNLLYDGTTLNDQHLDSKQYYLRLEYFNFMKDTFKTRVGAGVKIRRGNLVPYANARSRYELYAQNKHKAELYNRFRYYSDGEIENSLEFNALYTIRDDLYAIWDNTFFHINTTPYEVLANDFSFVTVLNDKQHIRYGFGISSEVSKFEALDVSYYYLHGSFHHVFYKDWAYYTISPSILQREINNFDTSYRLLLNFGIYFNN
ncbi:MAG: Unknown protein [uncultured Sulfurovum sp.]|uniref:Uncharacterized protein n=1 Tax=uncultured Sulfurovum sp. TaxID=269237 RepID=A0A6S6T991_9BACT|nr:MAG: Unknown protein [uncultured Sulfurovum sp.]